MCTHGRETNQEIGYLYLLQCVNRLEWFQYERTGYTLHRESTKNSRTPVENRAVDTREPAIRSRACMGGRILCSSRSQHPIGEFLDLPIRIDNLRLSA